MIKLRLIPCGISCFYSIFHQFFTICADPENSNVLMVIIGAAATLVIVCIVFGTYRILKSDMFKKLLGYEKDPYLALTKETQQYNNHNILDEVSLSNTSGAGRTQFVQVRDVYIFLVMVNIIIFIQITIKEKARTFVSLQVSLLLTLQLYSNCISENDF